MFPVEDPADIKRTWDGLLRANDPHQTAFLGDDENLLKRFLVFASLDAGNCAVFDRAGDTIWHEEEGELLQTSLSLSDFIETLLREVTEL